MTKFSEIKGFAFDLDGVITDTAKFHTQACGPSKRDLDARIARVIEGD